MQVNSGTFPWHFGQSKAWKTSNGDFWPMRFANTIWPIAPSGGPIVDFQSSTIGLTVTSWCRDAARQYKVLKYQRIT